MLQYKPNPPRVIVHGFLLAIELEEGVNLEIVANKLVDGVQWMEGCGKVVVDHLGELNIFPDTIEYIEGEEITDKSSL